MHYLPWEPCSFLREKTGPEAAWSDSVWEIEPLQCIHQPSGISLNSTKREKTQPCSLAPKTIVDFTNAFLKDLVTEKDGDGSELQPTGGLSQMWKQNSRGRVEVLKASCSWFMALHPDMRTRPASPQKEMDCKPGRPGRKAEPCLGWLEKWRQNSGNVPSPPSRVGCAQKTIRTTEYLGDKA